jgi:hypothetical protein
VSLVAGRDQRVETARAQRWARRPRRPGCEPTLRAFKLVYLDAYHIGGKPGLSGIWYKNAPNYNSWWEKHHLSASQFQAQYNTMLKGGYLTRCIAGYGDGNSARFEGIWSK